MTVPKVLCKPHYGKSIWKWLFANGEYPIRMYYRIFLKNLQSKTMPKVLCKPHYGKSHLEMAVCKWGTPHLVSSAL